MGKNLTYAGVRLDRAADLRRDDAWVAERLADAGTRILPVWRDRNLVGPGGEREVGSGGQREDGPGAVFLTDADAKALVAEAGHVALLGTAEGTAYFAVDVSGLDEDSAAGFAGGGEFQDLRRVGALMTGAEAALLAFARGLLHWHRRHVFCGVCGAPTESRQGGHMRVCGNADGGHEHFPRTDPAVIMLVSHLDPEGRGPACLLGRQDRWPEGVYSTLAGFVEPGESLEEAVAREVREESSVRVTDVRYQASQPWPFPSSLMLGFRAEAETTAIEIDSRELADARWFTPDDVRGFGEWGRAPAGARALPRRDSIARWLIEGWLGDAAG